MSDPIAVSRAWGLVTLLETPDRARSDPAAVPAWIAAHAPWLGRFWGGGLTRPETVALNQRVLEWSRSDPDGLVAAAGHIAAGRPIAENTAAAKLRALITSDRAGRVSAVRRELLKQLLASRALGLVEAAQILNAHRDEVLAVLSRKGYTDPSRLGRYLDRDLPE